MSSAKVDARLDDARESISQHELHRPELNPVDLAIAAAVGLFAVLWIWPFFSYSTLDGDEGISLQGAIRILNGELPYRDFFSFYTPGTYYLHSLLFEWFGATIQTARLPLLAYAVLFPSLTYLLARRAASRPAALLAAMLVALVCLQIRFSALHNWHGTAAALLALYCLVWLLQTRSAAWAFLAGTFAGFNLMIEHSKGAGVLLGVALAAAYLWWTAREQWRPSHLGWISAGAAIPTAVVLAYFGAKGALGAMMGGLLWPFFHYSRPNRLPYGYLLWNDTLVEALTTAGIAELMVWVLVVSALLMIPIAPLLGLWLSAVVAGRSIHGGAQRTALTQFVVVSGCFLFGIWLSVVATGRPDLTHTAYLAPLCFFLLPLLLDPRLSRLPRLSALQPLLVVYLLLAFVACSLLLTSFPWTASNEVVTNRGTISIARAEELFPFLKAHVPAGSKMLVYPYSPIHSFLSATMSPTRYEFLQVGMMPESEFEIAREQFHRNQTEVVIFDISFRGFVSSVWPTTPAEVLAKDAFGDYIFAQYRPCRALQSANRTFLYMVRKDLMCPQEETTAAAAPPHR